MCVLISQISGLQCLHKMESIFNELCSVIQINIYVQLMCLIECFSTLQYFSSKEELVFRCTIVNEVKLYLRVCFKVSVCDSHLFIHALIYCKIIFSLIIYPIVPLLLWLSASKDESHGSLLKKLVCKQGDSADNKIVGGRKTNFLTCESEP